MLKTRVIPCLLLKNQGLVETVKFSDPKYVGDPINAVKIFNEKEVDELIFLDIQASSEKRRPNFKLIAELASGCFMPLAYGGGIATIEDAKELFALGVEKIIINTKALEDTKLISEISQKYGSQSVVVSLDVKKNNAGHYRIYSNNGTVEKPLELIPMLKTMEKYGAGEIFINSIEHDGLMTGYNLELIKIVSETVSLPVVACGGAGKLEHFQRAVKAGASAVAAGSMFIFHGRFRSVLISYPSQKELHNTFELPI